MVSTQVWGFGVKVLGLQGHPRCATRTICFGAEPQARLVAEHDCTCQFVGRHLWRVGDVGSLPDAHMLQWLHH